MNKKIADLRMEMNKVIKGKDDIIVKIIMTVLASGHILLEDNPGLGKTTLAKTFSKATIRSIFTDSQSLTVNLR